VSGAARRPPVRARLAALVALGAVGLLAGTASLGVAVLAPSAVPQPTTAVAGTPAALPWIGLLGFYLANASGAAANASTDPLHPTWIPPAGGTFGIRGNLTGNSTWVRIGLVLGSGTPARAEFGLYVLLLGRGAGGLRPPSVPEFYLQVSGAPVNPTEITLAYNLGTPASPRVTSVTWAVSLCPHYGVCP
jgi:hypothetical protein